MQQQKDPVLMQPLEAVEGAVRSPQGLLTSKVNKLSSLSLHRRHVPVLWLSLQPSSWTQRVHVLPPLVSPESRFLASSWSICSIFLCSSYLRSRNQTFLLCPLKGQTYFCLEALNSISFPCKTWTFQPYFGKEKSNQSVLSQYRDYLADPRNGRAGFCCCGWGCLKSLLNGIVHRCRFYAQLQGDFPPLCA